MIESPFKKLFITALHGHERQATDSKKLFSFCGPPECNGGPAAAHELAHQRNFIAYLNSIHLRVQQCAWKHLQNVLCMQFWVSGANMRVQKRQKNVLLPPTNVAANACDKKDARVDRRAPQSSEPRA